MWGVCTPQYKNVYRVNRTIGSLVQDIFTNTIEHFEVCATTFIEKTIYIPRMGVHCIHVLHTDFTFQSFDLEQNSHLFAIVCEICVLI